MEGRLAGLTLALVGLLALTRPGVAAETLVLKLSHQFPAAASMEEGDFRDRLARKFAEEVEKRTDGELEVQSYPGSSLMKPEQQFNALARGSLDLSVFPLAYATGQVPQASIALLPGLVTSYEQALRWRDASIGKELEKVLEAQGIKLISWIWQAGAIVSDEPLVKPEDVKGMQVRGPGREVNRMLQAAGGSITSLPSSEAYTALQLGVLDSVWTVTTSLISFRLHEVADHATVMPEDKQLYFSPIILLMSKATFDKLTPEQQQVIFEVGREMDAFAVAEAKKDDANFVKVYQDAGAEVHVMDEATVQQWQEFAKSSAWKDFEENVEDGPRLLSLAQEVQ